MSETAGEVSAGLGGSVFADVLGISVFLSSAGLISGGLVAVGAVCGAADGLGAGTTSSLTGMMTIFFPPLMQTNGDNASSIWISLRLNLRAVSRYSRLRPMVTDRKNVVYG